MRLIQFYRNEIPTDDGDFIDDILTWNHAKLEGCHSYVQWLFPTKEESMFHPEVPTLSDEEIILFREDPVIHAKVYEAFLKILDFYGLRLCTAEPPKGYILPNANEIPPWLRQFNHNYLRITRILRSLRYMGFETESKALFRCLRAAKRLADDKIFEIDISENSFEYWKEAANGNL